MTRRAAREVAPGVEFLVLGVEDVVVGAAWVVWFLDVGMDPIPVESSLVCEAESSSKVDESVVVVA